MHGPLLHEATRCLLRSRPRHEWIPPLLHPGTVPYHTHVYRYTRKKRKGRERTHRKSEREAHPKHGHRQGRGDVARLEPGECGGPHQAQHRSGHHPHREEGSERPCKAGGGVVLWGGGRRGGRCGRGAGSEAGGAGPGRSGRQPARQLREGQGAQRLRAGRRPSQRPAGAQRSGEPAQRGSVIPPPMHRPPPYSRGSQVCLQRPGAEGRALSLHSCLKPGSPTCCPWPPCLAAAPRRVSRPLEPSRRSDAVRQGQAGRALRPLSS